MVSSADALVKQIDGGFHGREQGQSGGRESHPHLSPSPAGLLESPARQALAGRYGASRSRERRLRLSILVVGNLYETLLWEM